MPIAVQQTGLQARQDGSLRLRGADAVVPQKDPAPLSRRARPSLRAADHRGDEKKDQINMKPEEA